MNLNPGWTGRTLVWAFEMICKKNHKSHKITNHLVPLPLVRMPQPLQKEHYFHWQNSKQTSPIFMYKRNYKYSCSANSVHLIIVVPRRRLVIVAGKSSWPGLWVVKPTWDFGNYLRRQFVVKRLFECFSHLNAAAPLVHQSVKSDLKQLIVPFVRFSNESSFNAEQARKNFVWSSHLRGLWFITTPLLNSSNGLFRSAVRLLLNNLIKLPCRSWNLKRRV